jgi:hypothetical protein
MEAAVAAVDCVVTILKNSSQCRDARDKHGNVPLEGIFSGLFLSKENNDGDNTNTNADSSPQEKMEALQAPFHFRNKVLSLLSDTLHQVKIQERLYKIIEALPDDIIDPLGPTAEFIRLIIDHSADLLHNTTTTKYQDDNVLALLYRRFVRQFDQSERFFEGDNSRIEVIRHREWFKNAAVNTFNIVELLLQQRKGEEELLVHNAVKRANYCPPDLLRYVVETNLESVARKDERGNLPLHYAAGSGLGQSPAEDKDEMNVPNSYTKYVIDELLYAYPDGAAVPNVEGVLPIALAIESGKKWIGGGVRSLYEAYPAGLEQSNLDEDHPIIRSLSFSTLDVASVLSDEAETTTVEQGDDEEGTVATGVDGAGGRRRKRTHRKKINKDESHDAIMFVQREDAQVRDIVTTMWANEEDAGVQMLGCSALGRIASRAKTIEEIASVAVMGVTSVVNAMKNHPNEPAVQEKACAALTVMAPVDGVREVSFAASGAISTTVSAMQAHVGDASVQKEACRALRGIAAKGGADRATVVASVSGFTAIVNAMGAHPDDGEVQREACLAMEVLTSFHDAYLPDGVNEQSDALLQAAAENFPEVCLKPVNSIRGRFIGIMDV